MKIFSAIVSFNRLEFLKRTINSYLETITIPFDLIIVDNGSAPETREWIASSGIKALFLAENHYPGYATNRAWRLHEPSHDLLHRSDNDIHYLPGWSDALVEGFGIETNRYGRGSLQAPIGQVGLMTDEQEGRGMPAVGGNMAIRREVYEAGVRYTDESWESVPWEDGLMTSSVIASGWSWARVATHSLVHIGDPPDFDDPYYVATYGIRGILPEEVQQ